MTGKCSSKREHGIQHLGRQRARSHGAKQSFALQELLGCEIAGGCESVFMDCFGNKFSKMAVNYSLIGDRQTGRPASGDGCNTL